MAPIRCCFDQTAVWHSDAARGPSTPSFDHLVGEDQQRRWYCQPQRFGGLEIDREPEPRRLHGRKISGFCAVENSSGVDPDLTIPLRKTVAIGDQAAGCGELTPHIDRWNRITRRARNQVIATVRID